MAGPCERGIELFSSPLCGEFLDRLRTCWLFMKDFFTINSHPVCNLSGISCLIRGTSDCLIERNPVCLSQTLDYVEGRALGSP